MDYQHVHGSDDPHEDLRYRQRTLQYQALVKTRWHRLCGQPALRSQSVPHTAQRLAQPRPLSRSGRAGRPPHRRCFSTQALADVHALLLHDGRAAHRGDLPALQRLSQRPGHRRGRRLQLPLLPLQQLPDLPGAPACRNQARCGRRAALSARACRRLPRASVNQPPPRRPCLPRVPGAHLCRTHARCGRLGKAGRGSARLGAAWGTLALALLSRCSRAGSSQPPGAPAGRGPSRLVSDNARRSTRAPPTPRTPPSPPSPPSPPALTRPARRPT